MLSSGLIYNSLKKIILIYTNQNAEVCLFLFTMMLPASKIFTAVFKIVLLKISWSFII